LGPYSSSYTAAVPAYDVVFLIIRGTDAPATRYEAAASASSGRSVAIGGERSLTFKIAPIKRPTFVQIRYINPSNVPLAAQLRVDGQIPTNVLFPPTGDGGEVGATTIEVESKQTQPESTLTFSAPGAAGPVLESISVLAGAQ
jgi:hypothetical protein